MIDYSLILSAAVGAISAIFTNAGEKFLSRFFDRAAKRETQKESDLAILERVIFEVRDLSVSYWSALEANQIPPSTTGSIVGRLSFIAELSDSIFSSNILLLREMHTAINAFDLACTSGSFGSQKRAAEPERCRDIEIKAYSLFHKSLTLQRKI